MTEPERLGGISLSFPANEDDSATASSPKTLPRRLRRRLLEPKSPVSAEEIDSKLRDADLRRQVTLTISRIRRKILTFCCSFCSITMNHCRPRHDLRLEARDRHLLRSLANDSNQSLMLLNKRGIWKLM